MLLFGIALSFVAGALLSLAAGVFVSFAALLSVELFVSLDSMLVAVMRYCTVTLEPFFNGPVTFGVLVALDLPFLLVLFHRSCCP